MCKVHVAVQFGVHCDLQPYFENTHYYKNFKEEEHYKEKQDRVHF